MAKKPSNRVRSETLLIPIPDWQEADELLRRIGDLQMGIASIEMTAKNLIDEIKAELKDATEKPLADIKLHVESLQAFCAAHQEDFGKARSRKLQFGTVGWRASSAIKVCRDVIKRIKNVFGKKAEPYLRIREEADKEAMGRLTDGQLVAIGCRRETKDVFFAEPEMPEAVDY